MSKTVIKCSLNDKDIERAINELKQYKREFLKKEKRLLEGLAEIGIKEASVRFTTAMYDGINDVSVKLDTTNNGYAIVAEGKAVAFIEFGSGVYHNPSEPYPIPRPDGIVGIGQFGQGKGMRQAWVFKRSGAKADLGITKSSGAILTRGNPASLAMYQASRAMEERFSEVAREVFSK